MSCGHKLAESAGRSPEHIGGSLAEHCVSERRGRVGLHAGEDMLVDGHRERRAAVAQAFTDDLHRDVRLQEDRGVVVAEVVEADAPPAALAHQPLPRLREEVRVDRLAVRSREDKSVIVSSAGAQSLLELLSTPRPQHGDSPRVEVDRSPAVRRLHVGDVGAVLDRQDLLIDDEAGGVEVDVAPGNTEHLAPSHPVLAAR